MLVPIYEYRCRACGHRFEILQRLGEGAEKLSCPECGAERPERALSTFATSGDGGAQRGSGFAGAPSCGPGFT